MTAPTPLPPACQAAQIDGGPALSLHRERCTTCRERNAEPDDGALFDLPAEPPKGGQHL